MGKKNNNYGTGAGAWHDGRQGEFDRKTWHDTEHGTFDYNARLAELEKQKSSLSLALLAIGLIAAAISD